ncbi:MAG TPA: DUF262 domain-containing protein [Verrucomicrobiae bacterium]|nr:DUF262 domain-containing protein [Verrucomicrobiae bacterium]
MKFSLSQWKIEQLVGSFNDEVIDLTPPFQRGRVWPSKLRQGLLKNIIEGKPVPAVFLYKTPVGSKNNFVILDGKQRLESILLFIGHDRDDLRIPKWTSYIHSRKDRKQVGFKTTVAGSQKSLKELSNSEVIKFRDYPLSIIEIDFDDEVTLEEIIQLFVDINQSGIKVTRFDIVKALYLKDAFFKQLFHLIAIQEKRGRDTNIKIKSSSFSRVMKHLDIVNRVDDAQNRVDVMWERLCEFALFAATSQHRKPSQILKDLISRKQSRPKTPKLTSLQVDQISRVFSFLERAYKSSNLGKTRWATDQTHFYILVTALIEEIRHVLPINYVTAFPPARVDNLIKFDAAITGNSPYGITPTIAKKIKSYIDLSEKQTTDAAKRQDRVKLFKEIVSTI